MGRPKKYRASVQDVMEWDGRDVTEVPIPAATNSHDHSMFVTLADGSRLRVDRDFAEQAWQAAWEAGVHYWRTPTEYMRACLSLGVMAIAKAGLTNPRLDAMIRLDLAEAEIAWRETVGHRLQHLRDCGQNDLASEIERMIGDHDGGADTLD